MNSDYDTQLISTDELIDHFTEVRDKLAGDIERIERLLETLVNRRRELERKANGGDSSFYVTP